MLLPRKYRYLSDLRRNAFFQCQNAEIIGYIYRIILVTVRLVSGQDSRPDWKKCLHNKNLKSKLNVNQKWQS